MNRRELIDQMISTAMVAGLVTPWSRVFANPQDPGTIAPAETAQWLDRELRLVAARDSSEQSVPMYLGLENLAKELPAGQDGASRINPGLLEKFERYADLLLQFKSNPDESDAVALLVVMAKQEMEPETAGLCR